MAERMRVTSVIGTLAVDRLGVATDPCPSAVARRGTTGSGMSAETAPVQVIPGSQSRLACDPRAPASRRPPPVSDSPARHVTERVDPNWHFPRWAESAAAQDWGWPLGPT